MPNVSEWRPWFAWFPVRTESGIAWATTIERRWNNESSPWGDISGCSGADGGYEYRRVKP